MRNEPGWLIQIPQQEIDEEVDQYVTETLKLVSLPDWEGTVERWNTKENRQVHNEKIDAFLSEVVEVSKRHGLSIGHEDRHGGFLVHEFSQANADWLMAAADDTE